MDKMTDAYSKIYGIDFGRGVYEKLAKNSNLKKISGEIWDPLLVRGESENLILIKRDFKKKKEVIKIHSKNLEEIQSKLEKITGVDFSQYKVH